MRLHFTKKGRRRYISMWGENPVEGDTMDWYLTRKTFPTIH
jgi:hypothetical protein